METPQYYNTTQLFAQTVTTPAMISAHQLTPPPTVDPSSTTIKMEDLTMPFSSPGLPPTSHPSTPGPSESRQVKKRKSWGQVLPEPKTNLPPRKRAKTEDEKEQRRIERVKRNRLAAHNSRERKRQEVELLQAEKDQLEDDLRAAQQAMARMAAQLKALQKRFPGENFDQTFDASSPPAEDHDSALGQDTVCPRQTSFPSPVSMNSMDSPRDDSCQPETPGYAESVATDLDQTRYPAAILCDLQCQSSSTATCRQSLPAALAFLILFNLTLPSTRNLLTSSSALSRSQTTSLRNTLSDWVSSTATFSPPLSSKLTPQTLMAFLTNLMHRSSTCRKPLAQQTLATGLSQRKSSFKWVARPLRRRGRAGRDGARSRKLLRSLRLRQERRKGFSSAKGIGKALESSFGVSKRDLESGRRTEV